MIYFDLFSQGIHDLDCRRLNGKDSYPLPRSDDTIEALAGSEWFSTLDLKSSYWQVEMDDGDKEKTAFSIGSGLWQFTVRCHSDYAIPLLHLNISWSKYSLVCHSLLLWFIWMMS